MNCIKDSKPMKKPNAKEFHTDSGMHAAMRSWARTKDKRDLIAVVEFEDGSGPMENRFIRSKVDSLYKTRDGEVYSCSIDSSKFMNDFMPGADEMTQAEVKQAYDSYIREGGGVKNISWKWSE